MTPPDDDDPYDARVSEAGGASGDPQISLIWNNRNDLDLHCVTPSNTEIYYRNKVADRGTLDVDANVRSDPLTDTPVENIVWQPGTAPSGHYTVTVVYYGNNEDSRPNDYSVRVITGGESYYFTGTLTQVGEEQSVCEFDL